MSESTNLSGRKDAVKTYIEQTKVLITLASAFVVAPAASVVLLKEVNRIHFVASELSLVASVLAGYVVLSSLAGNQHRNVYNVHDGKTRITSLAQIFLFIAGLGMFVYMIANLPGDEQKQKSIQVKIDDPIPLIHAKDLSSAISEE